MGDMKYQRGCHPTTSDAAHQCSHSPPAPLHVPRSSMTIPQPLPPPTMFHTSVGNLLPLLTLEPIFASLRTYAHRSL